jgi:hypothetical protein
VSPKRAALQAAAHPLRTLGKPSQSLQGRLGVKLEAGDGPAVGSWEPLTTTLDSATRGRFGQERRTVTLTPSSQSRDAAPEILIHL